MNKTKVNFKNIIIGIIDILIIIIFGWDFFPISNIKIMGWIGTAIHIIAISAATINFIFLFRKSSNDSDKISSSSRRLVIVFGLIPLSFMLLFIFYIVAIPIALILAPIILILFGLFVFFMFRK